MSTREELDAVAHERRRILEEYRRREREIPSDRYAPWKADAILMRTSRSRLAAKLLHRAGVFPRAGDPCLEVGFGPLGWLGELLCWGLRQADLHGIELDPNRLGRVREILPVADLRLGDASALPWESESFRLVIASTVMSSILDSSVRRLVAQEITRVLSPGGALLWWDFRVDNPQNPHVRRVQRKELLDLFPTLKGEIRSVTLVPPLARLVAPRSWAIAAILESIPLLRTHLLGVLKKS
jgi:ubiquinone/menaquinone biosynthesis C-methylase UbiE